MASAAPAARRGAPPTAQRDNNKGIYSREEISAFQKFFATKKEPSKKRKRGRPRKKKPQAGPAPPPRKRIPADDEAAGAAETAGRDVANAVKPKARRRNWSKGKYKKALDRALASFKNKNDLFKPGESLVAFCIRVGVPVSVLKRAQKRVDAPEEGTRARGRQSWVPKEKQLTIINAVAALDEANDPANHKRIIDMVVNMTGGDPHNKEYRLKATRVWHKTIWPRGRKMGLLTGTVRAQAGTEGRTAAAAESLQRHWHETVDDAFERLKQLNQHIDNFDELMPHFIFNLDEECVMASGYTNKVVGSTAKKKHDDNSGTSRVSITSIRTGNAAGDSGPTFFAMSGQKRHESYTASFLVRNGAVEGSDIIMTPGAFMTDEAWAELVPKLVKGLRSVRVVRDYPDAWVLISWDGFKSHTKPTAAIATLHSAKVHVIVENRDSSTYNQVRVGRARSVRVAVGRGEQRVCRPLGCHD